MVLWHLELYTRWHLPSIHNSWRHRSPEENGYQILHQSQHIVPKDTPRDWTLMCGRIRSNRNPQGDTWRSLRRPHQLSVYSQDDYQKGTLLAYHGSWLCKQSEKLQKLPTTCQQHPCSSFSTSRFISTMALLYVSLWCGRAYSTRKGQYFHPHSDGVLHQMGQSRSVREHQGHNLVPICTNEHHHKVRGS